MGDWIKMEPHKDECPVDREQRVEVRWRHHEGTTCHRAGALNWDMVSAYRLLPNPPHSR